MKKRLLSLLLAICLLLGALPLSAFAANTGGLYFKDVPDNQWYAPAVNYLAARGWVSGHKDGSFYPNRDITRAEFVTILAGISGDILPEKGTEPLFTDVPISEWFEQYIRWGVENGIISGVSATRFNPNGKITRQEIAVILWRFVKRVDQRILPTKSTSTFTDNAKVSTWAKVEVSAVANAGLISGYKDKSFRPLSNASRAETCQILYNYMITCDSYRRVPFSVEDMRYIAHGCGEYEGISRPNILPAVENAYYNNDVHFLEVDLCWTSDEELVCLHAWGGDYPDQTTLKNFMQMKLLGEYDPMSLDMLADWLREHPDVYVVPDIKSNNTEALKKISEDYPDILEQFIPYLFHKNEYDKIHGLGFNNIVLAIYQMTTPEKKDPKGLVAFAKEKNLTGILLSVSDGDEYYKAAKGSGVPIWSYSFAAVDKMKAYQEKGTEAFLVNDPSLRLD